MGYYYSYNNEFIKITTNNYNKFTHILTIGEDEINLTVVKAEILSSTETIYDDEVITQYAGIYRYINNNSLVIKNNTENKNLWFKQQFYSSNKDFEWAR